MNTESRAMLAQRIDMDPVRVYRSALGDEWAGELAKLPAHMQPGIVRYVLLGIRPGSFLCAVFANERELAEVKADYINRPLLGAYQHFTIWGCPSPCHGSSDNVRTWCEAGGVVGREAAA